MADTIAILYAAHCVIVYITNITYIIYNSKPFGVVESLYISAAR